MREKLMKLLDEWYGDLKTKEQKEEISYFIETYQDMIDHIFHEEGTLI